MALTPQQLYDNALNQIRKQGTASHDDDGCLYRGPNGTMCAVGASIPDDLYFPGMEHVEIRYLLAQSDWFYRTHTIKIDKLREHLGEENEDLMVHLQRIHDELEPRIGAAFSMLDFEIRMKGLADKFGLNYTEAA